MKRQNVHIRSDQEKELNKRTKGNDLSKSEIIRRALDLYFKENYRDGQDLLI